MGQFVLLLQELPGDFTSHDRETLRRIVAEYTAWRESLERGGRFLGGNKLTWEGGRRLQQSDGQVRATDGPYSEAKEVLEGLVIIEADDYRHAEEIASTCPHLRYSRCVDVRAIDALYDPDGAAST